MERSSILSFCCLLKTMVMEPLAAAERKERCQPQLLHHQRLSTLRLLQLLLPLLCAPHRSTAGARRMHASSKKLLQEKWEDFHVPRHQSVMKASAVHLHRARGAKLASRARQPSKLHLDTRRQARNSPPPVAEGPPGVLPESLHQDLMQSKPTAELAFAAFMPGAGACFADAYEARIGCKAGCACQWYEECFSKEVLFKEDGTGGQLTLVDVGTCGMSLHVLGVLAMTLFWLGVLAIVFFRVRYEKQEAASQQESLVARQMLKMGKQPPKGVAVSVRTARPEAASSSLAAASLADSGGATSGITADMQDAAPAPETQQEQPGQQQDPAERSEPAPAA